MNSISGLRDMGCIRNDSMTPFKGVARVQDEALPEQHDLVSLGQDSGEISNAPLATKFVGLSESEKEAPAPQSFESVSNGSVRPEKTSVDSFDGYLLAGISENNKQEAPAAPVRVSDLGTITIMDTQEVGETSVVSELQTIDNEATIEMTNTLAMFPINDMASILASGGFASIND